MSRLALFVGLLICISLHPPATSATAICKVRFESHPVQPTAADVFQGSPTTKPSPEEMLQKADEAYKQGDFKAAEKLYFAASQHVEATYGSDDPRLAKSLIKLSAVYFPHELFAPTLLLDDAVPYQFAYRMGHFVILMPLAQRRVPHAIGDQFRRRYLPARPLLERAVKILVRSLGPEHADVADALEELGTLHLAMGDYDQAQLAFERMLAIHEKNLGLDNPELIRDLNTLAFVMRARRNLAESLTTAQRAERLLQIKDPGFLVRSATLYSLAAVQIELKDFRSAEELIAQAVSAHDGQVGRGHIGVLMFLAREHAFVLDKLKRKDEAKQQRKRADELRRILERRK